MAIFVEKLMKRSKEKSTQTVGVEPVTISD